MAEREIGGEEATAVEQRQLVQRLNDDGEANGRIQITFRDGESKPFGNQAETNHQQEAQTENNDSRVAVDKTRQRFAGEQHQTHGNNYRCHHHRQMVDHADGGDHRIEGEDGIQHHNLSDHSPELRALALNRIIAVFAFQSLIELNSRFKQQE